MSEVAFATKLKDFSITAAMATVIVGVLTLISTAATSWFGFASKDEELKVHLVEIAIGILRADSSKEDVGPARSWAIDVIEKDSGVKFDPSDRAALLHKSIKSVPYVTGNWEDILKNADILGKNGYVVQPLPAPKAPAP
jgi:hypothetical protein